MGDLQTMKRKKPVDPSIGKHIAELRVSRGMSQKQLASQLGITKRMVGYYEHGDASPSAQRLKELARALRCKPADIIQRIDGQLISRALPGRRGPDYSQ